MKKSNVLVLVNEVKDINFNFTKKVAKFLIEHDCCVYIENEYVSQVPLTKEYVKGRKNVYSSPAVKDYNTTTDSANRTVSTLMKIIRSWNVQEVTEQEDPLIKIINGDDIDE